jgi:hypothetical protein
MWGRKLLRHFFLASDFEGDDCSLKTLKTSPEIYTSVCFESQTVASNYQEFPNKKSRRLRYDHKYGKYQGVGLVQARACVACCL